MKNFDIVIIGAGPGGYVCAVRCAQLGMKTALVEKYETLGGTCLNVGCIPSKALLDSSEHFYKAKHEFSEHGIEATNLNVDIKKMIERKSKVVEMTTKGIDFLMSKNKIEVIKAEASFLDKNTLSLTNSKGEKSSIKATNFVIATGSKPAALPFAKIDKKRIITSTEALSLSELPQKLVIIGGGIIGLEMASIYNRLGSKVTILEYADKIGGTMDSELCKELQRVLKKQGVDIQTEMKVNYVENKDNIVKVKALDSLNNEKEFESDYCLIAVGRVPYTKNLGLDKVNIALDAKGRIPVNEDLRTINDNIFAIGDVVDGPMLAHKAEEEGVYVAEKIMAFKSHINYKLIPGIAYTWPEAAGIGKTEDELKAENISYKIGKFPFKASGRARASNDTDGFIKVLADKSNDEILGVHILGARAADIIMQAAIAMEYRASAEDVAIMCFGHPTFSEAFKEACLAATENRAIHI